MDPLTIVGLSLSVVSVAIGSLTSAGYRYRQARFGSVWGTILYLGRMIDTDTLQQRHWDINTWTDEEVRNWKDSQLASFNAIAVAGAIFASIGLTALQLPDMSLVHWSARACCVASMVLGVVSVTTATRQHQSIGMLKSPLEVRLWLSRGRPTFYLKLRGLLKMHETEWAREKYAEAKGFSELPLESSISGLKAVALPRHLLDLAVLLFMFGIGLYELSGWKFNSHNLASSHDEYRNVFIVFIITLGLYVIYDVTVSVARIVDDDKRNTEFETNTLGGFHSPERLRELEDSLKRIRESIDVTSRLDGLLSRSERMGADLDDAESTNRNMAQDLAGMRAEIAQLRASNRQLLRHNEDRTAQRMTAFAGAGIEHRRPADP